MCASQSVVHSEYMGNTILNWKIQKINVGVTKFQYFIIAYMVIGYRNGNFIEFTQKTINLTKRFLCYQYSSKAFINEKKNVTLID